MTPNKRRTGPGHPASAPPRSQPAVPSKRTTTRLPGPDRRASATPSRVTPKAVKRFRPPWHFVMGIVVLVLGVAVAAINDAMLLGGVPSWLLPGGHNEGYLIAGVALAGWSTWWFGWFDRAR